MQSILSKKSKRHIPPDFFFWRKIMSESLYLGIDKDGKQVGLFKTHEQAFLNNKVHTCEFWDLNVKTGQYHPTIHSIGKLELVPKKDESNG